VLRALWTGKEGIAVDDACLVLEINRLCLGLCV
jgi:hypothetical protein